MRAVLCRDYGPLERLEVAEAPSPPIAPGAVRVAVHAAGINFADLLIVQGKYQEKPPLPFSPGFEIAGVVSELDRKSTRLNSSHSLTSRMPSSA